MTETDPDALLAAIDDVGRRGYAIVQNQTVVGDISVAAAITDHLGRPVGAINVSVPATRWTIERAEEQARAPGRRALQAPGRPLALRALASAWRSRGD